MPGDDGRGIQLWQVGDLEHNNGPAIALGLLFAAINGEFDLSIEFLSGFLGALVAWLSIDHGWPAMASAPAGMLTAAFVELVNGFRS